MKRLMKLTGIKTRKEAIDYALTEAERAARIISFYQSEFYVDAEGSVVDPDYDVMVEREKEKPGSSRD